MRSIFSKMNSVRSPVMVRGDFERNIFTLFVAGALLSSVFYFYLLVSTNFNLVERRNAENGNRALKTRVSELELAYLSESKKLDMGLARALGFKEVNKPFFAGRSALGKAPSLASNDL